MVEGALAAADADGDDLQRAEARLLWTRHVLWTGQLEAAAHSIDLSADDWGVLGLPEPLPLVRQRRALRLLQGRPVDPAGVPPLEPDRPGVDGEVPTLLHRAGPAELAFRLARSGATDRAGQLLDAVAARIGREYLPLSDLALVAGAATLTGRRTVARALHPPLVAAGDRLVARGDGSVILGPAGLWAAVAALGAGRKADTARLTRSAVDAVQRTGGSHRSLEVVAELFGLPISNRPPTHP